MPETCQLVVGHWHFAYSSHKKGITSMSRKAGRHARKESIGDKIWELVSLISSGVWEILKTAAATAIVEILRQILAL